MNTLEINGVKVVADIHVSDTSKIRRSWKERILTLPWQPLKTTKSIYYPRIYILDGVAIVSPQTFDILEKEKCLTEGEIVGSLFEAIAVKKAFTKGDIK